jgi:hypothetical protein
MGNDTGPAGAHGGRTNNNVTNAQQTSKSPPAEPEGLRLLATQRGLIAIVNSHARNLSTISSALQSSDTRGFPAASKLPALNRASYWNRQTSTAPPGRAGGTPGWIRYQITKRKTKSKHDQEVLTSATEESEL